MSLWHWVWLSEAMGAATVTEKLFSKFSDAEQIYNNRSSLFAAGLCTSAQAKRMAALKPEDMQKLVQKHIDAGFGIVCRNDKNFPEKLKGIDTCPPVLYYKGNISVINDGTLVGVVGARNPSAYGAEAAKYICAGLSAAGVVTVSGLAAGLDSEAHKAAVTANIPTVAVIGTAIDVCYPANNATLRSLIEKNGVIISEYPMGSKGLPANFVQRNRIIAALGDALCVIEAKMRSGTMSTVNFALGYGKDIYAVPGSIFSKLSEGTNSLIAEGARPVQSAADILRDLGIEEKLPQKKVEEDKVDISAFSADEKAVYSALGTDGTDITLICRKTGLSPAAAMAALTMLEISGAAKQLPGRKFCKAV